jgi:hypothetical protein
LPPRDTPRPAEPRTQSDGSWSWGAQVLTAAEARTAADAYRRLRAAEGRDQSGAYGEVGITPTLRRIEALLEHGWLAPDAGRGALADADQFKAELARLIEDDPVSPPARLAARVRNGLTYAFVFPPDRYPSGVRQVQEALLASGYVLLERRNDWGSVAGKCVVTVWLDQVHDLLFQVQIHTPASLEARELARTSAALISDPRIPFAEVAHLRADLAAAWAALPQPPGTAEISSYRA